MTDHKAARVWAEQFPDNATPTNNLAACYLERTEQLEVERKARERVEMLHKGLMQEIEQRAEAAEQRCAQIEAETNRTAAAQEIRSTTADPVSDSPTPAPAAATKRCLCMQGGCIGQHKLGPNWSCAVELDEKTTAAQVRGNESGIPNPFTPMTCPHCHKEFGYLNDPRPPAAHPQIGEQWEGGIYAGLTIHDNQPMALVLLPGDESLNWNDATAWAEKQGGELPSRIDQLVLLKNVKDQFKAELYWSGEQYAPDYDSAWCQDFLNGGQDDYHEGNGCGARAVRRLPITNAEAAQEGADTPTAAPVGSGANPDYPAPAAATKLSRAWNENRCGDQECEEYRLKAAILVLTGGVTHKENADKLYAAAAQEGEYANAPIPNKDGESKLTPAATTLDAFHRAVCSAVDCHNQGDPTAAAQILRHALRTFVWCSHCKVGTHSDSECHSMRMLPGSSDVFISSGAPPGTDRGNYDG